MDKKRLIGELRDKIKNKTKEIDFLNDLTIKKFSEISIESEITKLKLEIKKKKKEGKKS